MPYKFVKFEIKGVPVHSCYDDTILTNLLRNVRTIAIIGAKDNPSQAVHLVGTYLLAQGYALFPVHPVRKNIWNLTTFKNVLDIPSTIDMVVVFRAPQYCAGHAREVLALQTPPKAFWMQSGISSPEASHILLEKGIMVVDNLCSKIEHERLAIAPSLQPFDCKQCGHCCLGKGGIVLTPKDIHRLITALQISREAFLERYTETRQGKFSLITNDVNACIFFHEQKQCLIHNDKPDVCRAWPFFAGNMHDNISLNLAKDFCHGIHPAITHDVFVKAGNAYLTDCNISISNDPSQPNALKPTSS